VTFFHWGLHAWAIYAVVGLALAYFAYRHNLPLKTRSALYPLIGKKIYGPWGDSIDIFATIGTVFGVATSLDLVLLKLTLVYIIYLVLSKAPLLKFCSLFL
jgi:choline/glycine/proline betaine transport protein